MSNDDDDLKGRINQLAQRLIDNGTAEKYGKTADGGIILRAPYPIYIPIIPKDNKSTK